MARRPGDEDHIVLRGDEWIFTINDANVGRMTSSGFTVPGNLTVEGNTNLGAVTGSVILSSSGGGGVAVTGNLNVTDGIIASDEIKTSAGIVADTESVLSGGLYVTGSIEATDGKNDWSWSCRSGR